VEIPSHRVIVAARCDWFRRALMSGMKEAIQRFVLFLFFFVYKLAGTPNCLKK